MNEILKNIKERRSISRFREKSVDEEKLESILEAGRWAPSWMNKQPWKFFVIENQDIKNEIGEAIPPFSRQISTAPILIVVATNSETDPKHYPQDGATATQNMALQAHSLGLGSIWIGVHSLEEERREKDIKDILEIENPWRVISLLPIGHPEEIPKSERLDLSEIVERDYIPSYE